MDANPLLNLKPIFADGVRAELVVYEVPEPVLGSTHSLKYRLALIADDLCVMRYDNERGKGDHKHIGEQEVPYAFVDYDTLLKDFWDDVSKWRAKRWGL